MMQMKRWTVAVQLCTLIAASSFAIAQDDSSVATQGSIIGFAVVLSFLVISIFVVMLICSCYGLCKCPCKRAAVARDARAPHSSSSRRRRERPMIPLPSPRVGTAAGTVKQSASSTFQQHGQMLPTSATDQPIYSKLRFGRNQPVPPAAAAANTHEDERRLNQLSPTRYSGPPTSTSASNVIHLGQLQSHSYHSDLEQMALAGSINPPSIGRQGGRAYQPQQQRPELGNLGASRQMPNASWTANSNSTPPPLHHHHNPHPPHFQSKTVDVPPPYPGMGYPYTPCKSPKTPHSTSSATNGNTQPSPPSHSQLHSRRTGARQQASEAEGQGAGGGIGGESEPTDIDSVTESNSVVSGRGRFTELATSPPSYSTEV